MAVRVSAANFAEDFLNCLWHLASGGPNRCTAGRIDVRSRSVPQTTESSMSFRAAIYARYSSDSQREASIEDRVRLCKERLAREGWELMQVCQDRAIRRTSPPFTNSLGLPASGS